MTISVKCKKCKQGYKLGDDKAGKRFKCRKCGAPVSVPKADDFDDDFADDFADDYGDEHEDEYGDEPEDVAPARPRKSSSKKSAGKKGTKKGSKKGSGKSPVIFIVGGIAALLLVVGSVIGGIFIFGGDDEPVVNAKKIVEAKEEPKKKAAKPRDRNGPLHLAFLPDNCIGAFIIQPQRLQQSDMAKQLIGNVPVKSSIDPRDMEMLVFFVTTPKSDVPEPPRDEFFAIAMRGTKPINVQEVAKEQIADGSEPESVTFQKQTYLRIPLKSQKESESGNPSSGPLAVCAIDEKTVILGSEDQVKKMLAPTAGTDSQIYARLEKLDLDNDIIGLVMISELYKNKITRKLIETAKIDMALGLPPNRQDLLSLPESIESLTASINISGGTLLKLVFEGKDSSATERLFVTAKSGENELKQFYVQMQQAPQQPQGFSMIKGIVDPLIAAFSVTKDAQNVILELKKPVDLEKVLEPILAAAFSQAQVAASRSVTRNKMKQVGLAFINYEETFGSFPPHNKAEFFTSDGQPKLSWRVYLLPFLGDGNQLFKKFKLDEPWDSPNNKPLIKEMPDVYRLDDVLDSGGKTRLVVLVGPGTPFHNLKQRGPKYSEFTDGTSNTLLALEVGADKAIEWTKPESDNFDPNNPLATLGDIPPSFNVLFADGRVMTLSSDRLLAKTLKAIATHQGKERFDPNELREAGPSNSGGSLPPRSGGSLPPSSADPEPPPPVSNSPQKGK